MQFVGEYRYLGVVLDRHLAFTAHSRMLQERALRVYFQCTSWAQRERLPLSVLERLVSSYVVPACLYGTELMQSLPGRMRELDALQRRIGRYLLRSNRAANGVVLGDLGWRPWSSMALQRAAGLLCRLSSANVDSLSHHVYACAAIAPGTWAADIGAVLAQRGVPLPNSFGITCGSPSSARARYMRTEVGPRLAAEDLAHWRLSLANASDAALQVYSSLVRQPAISLMHCWRVSSHGSAAWARIRGGSSCLPAERASRQALGCSTCTLCGSDEGNAVHMISSCPALAQARAVWLSTVGPAFSGLDSAASLMRCFFAVSPQPPYVLAAHAAFAVAIESAFSRR